MTFPRFARAPLGFPYRLLLILALCGAAIVPLTKASRMAHAADPPATEAAVPDFTGYQELLNQYLTAVSAPGAALETRFDYSEFRKSSDFGPRMVAIHKQIFAGTPSKMDAKARMAWAINAYNYLVLETVTKNLYEGTQRSNHGGRRVYYAIRIATVQTIGLDGGSFFDAPLVTIEGTPYSLNTFERHFVFNDFDPSAGNPKPPASLDPRAHFALVCAAKGCPPLQPRAYRADSIDKQLEQVTHNALASPNHLRFDTAAGRLEASSIFNWYQADFGGADGALAFVKKYAPPATRSEIEKRKVPWINAYILWDWKLNTTDEGGADSTVTQGAKTSG